MPDQHVLNEAINEAMEASGNPIWVQEIDITKAFIAYQICLIIDNSLIFGFRGPVNTEFGVMDNPPSQNEKKQLLRLRRRLIKSCLPPASAQVLLQRIDEVDNASQARR